MSDQKPPTDKLQPQTNEKAAELTGAPGSKNEGQVEKKKLPQLGALEDDDEFEVSFFLPGTIIEQYHRHTRCCN
jgi:hypothetical protein